MQFLEIAEGGFPVIYHAPHLIDIFPGGGGLVGLLVLQLLILGLGSLVLDLVLLVSERVGSRLVLETGGDTGVQVGGSTGKL